MATQEIKETNWDLFTKRFEAQSKRYLADLRRAALIEYRQK